MATFCDKCGAEVKDENAKFCHKCGAEISAKTISTIDKTVQSGVFCSHCGQAVPLGQTVCLNCGQSIEDNKVAIIIGYIFAILFPIISLIISIYLLTRNNEKSKKHGAIILALTIINWAISFLLIWG